MITYIVRNRILSTYVRQKSLNAQKLEVLTRKILNFGTTLFLPKTFIFTSDMQLRLSLVIIEE